MGIQRSRPARAPRARSVVLRTRTDRDQAEQGDADEARPDGEHQRGPDRDGLDQRGGTDEPPPRGRDDPTADRARQRRQRHLQQSLDRDRGRPDALGREQSDLARTAFDPVTAGRCPSAAVRSDSPAIATGLMARLTAPLMARERDTMKLRSLWLCNPAPAPDGTAMSARSRPLLNRPLTAPARLRVTDRRSGNSHVVVTSGAWSCWLRAMKVGWSTSRSGGGTNSEKMLTWRMSACIEHQNGAGGAWARSWYTPAMGTESWRSVWLSSTAWPACRPSRAASVSGSQTPGRWLSSSLVTWSRAPVRKSSRPSWLLSARLRPTSKTCRLDRVRTRGPNAGTDAPAARYAPVEAGQQRDPVVRQRGRGPAETGRKWRLHGTEVVLERELHPDVPRAALGDLLGQGGVAGRREEERLGGRGAADDQAGRGDGHDHGGTAPHQLQRGAPPRGGEQDRPHRPSR